MLRTHLLRTTVAVVGTLALLAPRAHSGEAAVSEVASYTFSEPLLNGMGVTSLDDLRGKPVLIEFWGTR
jgi:hypothetical protein